LGYRRAGNQDEARRWFRLLAQADPDRFCRWDLRYSASEATDLFIRQEFRGSAALWEEIAAKWDDGEVRARLVLALLHDAASRVNPAIPAAAMEDDLPWPEPPEPLPVEEEALADAILRDC
jgi:hypothetical protein